MALIPSTKLPYSGAWTPNVLGGVGVVGGIVDRSGSGNIIDVTEAPYNADPTGVADSTSAIQDAIGDVVDGGVVYLPAGTYKCSEIGWTRQGGGRFAANNWTLLGDVDANGNPTTTIHSVATGGVPTAIYIGIGASFDSGAQTISSAALTAGATTVTVSDTSNFNVNQHCRIVYAYDPDVPIVSVRGFTNQWTQTVYITGKTSNTLTFTPGIPGDLTGIPAGTTIAPSQYDSPQGIGIENIIIDGQVSEGVTITWGIQITLARNCWFKNVWTTNCNKGIFLYDSTNLEVRGCYIQESGSAGSNLAGVLVERVSSLLYEDNIGLGNQPNLEINFGTCLSVFAYNFWPQATNALSLNNNHGPHNMYNLYEGNITPTVISDGYFGGESEVVFYRNWITNLNGFGGAAAFGFAILRFTRNWAAVGNVLLEGSADWSAQTNRGLIMGDPPGGSTDGSAELSTGDAWQDWSLTTDAPKSWAFTLTTRTTDYAGEITINTPADGDDFEASAAASRNGDRVMDVGFANFGTIGTRSGNVWPISNTSSPLPGLNSEFTIRGGPLGFQELDLDVENTATLKYNYSYYDDVATPSLGGDTLEDSLFRSAKPDFFGTLDWPPISPDTPPGDYTGAVVAPILPAAYRFVNGTDDYLGEPAVATPVFTPGSATYNNNQSVEITCATTGASIYYTTDGSTPDNTDTEYTGAIAINGTATLKAVGYVNPNYSSVRTGVYTLTVATPSFSPEPGIYDSGQNITISTETTGATLYYTVDNTTPDNTDTQYTGPVAIGSITTETLKAIGYKTNYTTSSVTSGVYSINEPPAPTGGMQVAGTVTVTSVRLSG